jgi:hypothetical protein
MLPSVISAFTGLFFKPRRMELPQGFDLMLKPSARHDIDTFLFLFLTEASQSTSDPFAEVLDRLIVHHVDHKQTVPPGHEFLIIHTHDTAQDLKERRFVLERTVSTERSNPEITLPPKLDMNTNIDDDIDIGETTPTPLTTRILETIRKVVDAIVAAISSESESDSALAFNQRSMEEGTSGSFSPSASVASVASESSLSIDGITVSVSEAADSVSESLDREGTPAYDRFLGQDSTTSSRLGTGETLRHFTPSRLTFFELVILAFAVHKQYPRYTTLKKNCMFYASLVYEAAEQYGGNADSGSPVSHSQLGRWKGVKVSRVEPETVSKSVVRFKRELARHIRWVILCSFKLFSLIQSK